MSNCSSEKHVCQLPANDCNEYTCECGDEWVCVYSIVKIDRRREDVWCNKTKLEEYSKFEFEGLFHEAHAYMEDQYWKAFMMPPMILDPMKYISGIGC